MRNLSLSLAGEVFVKEPLPNGWSFSDDGKPWGNCHNCLRKLGPKSWVKTEDLKVGKVVCAKCFDRECAEKNSEKAIKGMEAWKETGFARPEPSTRAQCLELALAGLNLITIALNSLIKIEKSSSVGNRP